MIRSLDRPPIPRLVPFAPAWRMGQFIKVEPPQIHTRIEAPIKIELGGLPLSIGLFAGSGLTFLVRTALPEGWPQTAALVAGAGLAVAGVVNLAMPKAEAQTPAAAAPGPTPAGMPAPSAPAPVAPGEAAAAPAPGSSPSEKLAFANVTGRIVYPSETSTVDLWPWSKSYPVRVQLHNPTQVPATFELELSAEEDPHPTGSPAVSSLPVQVSLAPGQVRDVDISMPIATWDALVDYVNVDLTVKKRRVPGEPAERLDFRFFVIE